MKKGILYEINNKINGKKYIGVTYSSISRRWSGHKSKAKQGDKRPLYTSIRKYGIENFEVKVLMEDVPENYLNISSARAVYMIDKNSDEIIARFETIKDAVEWIVNNTAFEMKIQRSMIGSIVRVCKNKTKTAYGYKWKYA